MDDNEDIVERLRRATGLNSDDSLLYEGADVAARLYAEVEQLRGLLSEPVTSPAPCRRRVRSTRSWNRWPKNL